jgi:hypothetical protein
MNPVRKRFRVALSFPGAKREYVQSIADALAARFGEEKVLYDRFHTAEFADANLAFNLPELYRKESDLIVVVLCGEYVEREWCGLEWRAIYALIKEGRSKDVMLFRADHAEIRGLYGLEGYVPTDAFTPDEAVKLIIQRLAVNEGKSRDFYLKPGESPARSTDLQTAVTRLHRKHDAGVFEGREEVLTDLDGLWADVLADKPGRAQIVSLIAIGGAGKTTVAARWKDALLAREGHGGVERYFDWSFYSQGARREGDNASAHTAADATVFVAAALKFFGDAAMVDSPASAWDKGARLATLVAQHRTVLILDGLEPLQYPPGPQTGELKDDAIRALFAGLQSNGRGLCVVTTRESIADFDATRDTTTPGWKLDHLTDAAGALVLSRHGVIGPEDELQRASAEVKGHALTLTLMGRYLKLAFNPPDIARRDCFCFSEADAETQNGHAFRVFAAYEKWFENSGRNVELAILRLLGLFDRPATPDCLAAMCATPAIPGLTEPLVGLGEKQWNVALQRLDELDLIERIEWIPMKVCGYGKTEARAEMVAGSQKRKTDIGEPRPFDRSLASAHIGKSIDAHPILREYFDLQLEQQSIAPIAHARLYMYLCASVPYWPEGRDGLLPLYQAVAHGCKAGLFEEACAAVYRDRILRGTDGVYSFYSMKILGLVGLDLAAVACFFLEPWRELVAGLSTEAKSWLLHEAAVRLRGLNRLREAMDPMRLSMEQPMREENWKGAAGGAANLCDLQLTLGDVSAAAATAAQSVVFADKSNDGFLAMTNRATQADVLQQMGRLKASRALFRAAEAMQAKLLPDQPLLYSVRGYQFCDRLLAPAERSAWCRIVDPHSGGRGQSRVVEPPAIAELTAIQSRVEQSLKLVEGTGKPLLNVALNELTLGRVHVFRAILRRPKLEVTSSKLYSAREHLNIALDTLRQAARSDYLPRALLPCALLHALTGEWDAAYQRLDEAYGLATRGGKAQNGWLGGMRLHLIDTLLHRARLFGRRSDDGVRLTEASPPAEYPWPGRTPAADLAEAATLIDSCGYHRRDQELADAREALWV